MEKKKLNLQLSIIQVVIIGVILVMSIVIFATLSNIGRVIEYRTTTDNATYISTETLSTSLGISSIVVKTYNDSFISCDGNNDYIKITPTTNDTLAFWYNSSTSEQWQFVVNNLGTQYTNGTQVNPVEYPVYWDGTDYYFCKTDATTFWEGSIDSISVYDGQLTQTQVNTIYLEGRK